MLLFNLVQLTELIGLNPQIIITGRPKVVLSLRFHLFDVRCCTNFVIILTPLCVQIYVIQ